MPEVTACPENVTILTEDGIEWVITIENPGFSAKAIGHPIFTQGATMEEVVANIKEATEVHSLPDPDNTVYLSEKDWEVIQSAIKAKPTPEMIAKYKETKKFLSKDEQIDG
jgi:PHD/YefM family antitoxin component YafN of YafNO toxin-antitoxin module